MNFTLINPQRNPPQIISSSIVDGVFYLTTNKYVTVYFSLGPPFWMPPTLEQIKEKKLPYDYFNYPFTIGEYVNASTNISFALPFTDKYILHAYIEDLDGTLSP